MLNDKKALIRFLNFAGAADPELNVEVWLKSEGQDREPQKPLMLRKKGFDRSLPQINTLRGTKLILLRVHRKKGGFRIEIIAERPWRKVSQRGMHSLLSVMRAAGF